MRRNGLGGGQGRTERVTTQKPMKENLTRLKIVFNRLTAVK